MPLHLRSAWPHVCSLHTHNSCPKRWDLLSHTLCRDALPLTGRGNDPPIQFLLQNMEMQWFAEWPRSSWSREQSKGWIQASPKHLTKLKNWLSILWRGKIAEVICSEVFAQLQYSCLVVSLWSHINQLRESHLRWMSTQIVKKRANLRKTRKKRISFFQKKRKDWSLISSPKSSPPLARLHA